MQTITSNGDKASIHETRVISTTIPHVTEALLKVLQDYAVPDPKIVSKLPKGGVTLDFVGHADITRILIEADPLWYWEPIKFDDDGLPAYRVENGMAHMAGRLCLLGVERVAIGSAPHDKKDLLKELVSDFLRNGAMRFGISLNLWTKSEWEDLGGKPTAPAKAPVRQTGQMAKPEAPADNDAPLTEEQIEAFNKACSTADLNPMSIYKDAKVKFGFAKQSDLGALRKAFTDAKTRKAEAE